MAMNGNILGDAILAAVDAAVAAISDPNNMTSADRKTIMRALANAIVTHIQGNANATGIDAPSGDTHNLTIT